MDKLRETEGLLVAKASDASSGGCCVALRCALLCALLCAVLHCAVLCAVLHCAVRCAVLCAVLCCALCCAALCCAVLCCAALQSTLSGSRNPEFDAANLLQVVRVSQPGHFWHWCAGCSCTFWQIQLPWSLMLRQTCRAYLLVLLPMHQTCQVRNNSLQPDVVHVKSYTGHFSTAEYKSISLGLASAPDCPCHLFAACLYRAHECIHAGTAFTYFILNICTAQLDVYARTATTYI